MQKILILTFLFTVTIWADTVQAGCSLRSASTLSHTRDVGPVEMLITRKEVGYCAVRFEITVDRVRHQVKAEQSGSESSALLCNRAIEQGRADLLAGMAGRFETEAVTICTEDSSTIQKLRIGDMILENEVGRKKNEGYFEYQHSKCRMFVERRGIKGKLTIYEGVICRTDDSGPNWIVMDRW